MADGVFNIARGRIVEFQKAGNSSFGVLLLRANDGDGVLSDFDTVAALIGNANTVEADFTNYTRKTGIQPTLAVNDTTNTANLAMANQTWSSAGGTADNTLTKLVTYFEVDGSDANRVPCTFHDFSITTNGNDLTAQINQFYGSS